MEYWGPWSSFLKKSGGTIAGNLIITGTLQVDGVVTFNNDANINGQVVIVHDDAVGALPHLKLKSATPAGNVEAMWSEASAGGFKGAIGGLGTGEYCVIPAIGGPVAVPCDALGGAPLWKVPNLTDALDARRMLMLHSIMFGL